MDYINDSMRSLYRKLLPSAVGSMLTATAASLVDTIILSHYLGPSILSCVSLCMPIYMLLNALSLLIVSGGATVYAFYVGKGDSDESNRYFNVSALLMTLVGVVLMVVGVSFTSPIVRLLGANDVVFQSSYEYARVLMFFMIPLMLYSQMLFFVRFDSDPTLSLIATCVCAVSNIILDILFVGPLGWGPAGAALATCLAYIFGLLTNCIHFLRKKNTLRLMRHAMTRGRVARVLKTGAPLSLALFGMALAISVFNTRIMHVGGEQYVTVYAIITQLSMSAMAFCEGVGQAAQPIMAANFGAGNRARIRDTMRTGIWLEIALTVLCALVYIFAAQAIAGFFSIFEGELLGLSLSAIRIYALAIPFTGINVLIMYYFQAQEDALSSGTISILHGTIFLIAGLTLLTALFGVKGIWWSWLFAETITLPVSLYLLARSRNARIM